jgi:DegV family protein with EDD domain
MARICILTDSTAQFTRPNFPGRERVYVIPFDIQPVKLQEEEPLPDKPSAQQLIPPSQQDFFRFYSSLSSQYDSILVLMLSSLLSPALERALSASLKYSNHASVEVVDSQTTAVGLGMLVQAAAGVAAEGGSAKEVEQRVRAAIPHLYTLFCIPELTSLSRAGHLDPTQALAGEMMGLMPLFALDEGQLTPVEKVRTPRHLFESFQEFISEFEAPAHIALMRGVSHTTVRTRPLRQYVQETFPATPFSEHALSPSLAALFGPQSSGVVIMERQAQRSI